MLVQMNIGNVVASTQHKRRNEMSRETQFIGLNNYAEDYISNDKVKKVGQYPMTKGMFEEDTPEGLIITNVTNNRVYQIFHDLRGKIELEAGYGYDVF